MPSADNSSETKRRAARETVDILHEISTILVCYVLLSNAVLLQYTCSAFLSTSPYLTPLTSSVTITDTYIP